MHIYNQILLYILNENTIWPSGAIARDIVSQEKNTMWGGSSRLLILCRATTTSTQCVPKKLLYIFFLYIGTFYFITIN